MNRPSFRAAAAFAIGQIANAEFLPELKQLVTDSDSTVRSGAVKALLKIQRAKAHA